MPNPESGAMGLLCLAGRARIVVPASDILQVIEYPVSARLPLAARFVGGLGSFDGRVLISVALDSKPDGAVQRLTKGLLVSAGGPRAPAWAIEVSQVRALVEVSAAAVEGIADHPEKASFLRWRKTRDDELVGWIDVARMLSELGQARASNVAS
jgi:chemotaxis signal transduction protein